MLNDHQWSCNIFIFYMNEYREGAGSAMYRILDRVLSMLYITYRILFLSIVLKVIECCDVYTLITLFSIMIVLELMKHIIINVERHVNLEILYNLLNTRNKGRNYQTMVYTIHDFYEHIIIKVEKRSSIYSACIDDKGRN